MSKKTLLPIAVSPGTAPDVYSAMWLSLLQDCPEEGLPAADFFRRAGLLLDIAEPDLSLFVAEAIEDFGITPNHRVARGRCFGLKQGRPIPGVSLQTERR